VEDRVWVQVAGHERVYPIADEDLEREDSDKTSSVHFLRFELTPGMVAAVKSGATVGMGIDHDHYRYEIEAVSPNVRDSLAADLG
jgi:precorrin-3B methylase